MFQLIPSDDLILGKKYMIVLKGDKYAGTYRGPITVSTRTYLSFDNVYDIIEEQELINPFYFTHLQRYYTFVSEQPQWNMERRSLNIILRRLIGDECFEW